MKKNAAQQDRPNVSTVLWWDWDYEKMNFRKARIPVIARIIEKGTKEEYDEMVRFYGLDLVLHTLKHDIRFLADFAIEDACNYFSLQKEEIRCYIEKRSRPNFWI